MPTTYALYATVRETVTFKDASSDVADPTAVYCYVTKPTASVSTFTYGVSTGDIKRSSTGVYYLDIPTTGQGIYSLLWKGTGTVAASVYGWFSVRTSPHFTFGNNPDSSNRDLLRILLHDTASGSAKFSDETLDWLAANSASIWYAAAEAADLWAAHIADGGMRKKVGDLEIDYGSVTGGSPASYREMAQRFRARGARSAAPFAGGIYQSDKDAEKTDSDRVHPAFAVGVHDYTGSTTTGYSY